MSEREMDNYPNGLTKSRWARWWHGASWQRRDVVVVVVAAPVTVAAGVFSGGKYSAGSGKHNERA